MKNHWLEMEKNKAPRSMFELLGHLYAVEVKVWVNNLPGLCICSTDPKFMQFVNLAPKLYKPTAYMSFIVNNSSVETCMFDEVEELEYTFATVGKNPKKHGMFRFDCSNKSSINSKFFFIK